jgi:hypothetical protein
MPLSSGDNGTTVADSFAPYWRELSGDNRCALDVRTSFRYNTNFLGFYAFHKSIVGSHTDDDVSV